MSDPLIPYDGRHRLASIDPADTGKWTKSDAQKESPGLLERLFKLHYLMYADNRRSLLVILQGIDGSGKDGTVRHLASGLNPIGCTVRSFKVPNDVEQDHDYLWRVHQAVPARGDVALFNRSHYEDVIVPVVHPAILESQQLPGEILRSPSLIEERYRQINDFERMLAANGTVILKFLLLISKEEQMKRFDERLSDPTKQWKFSAGDLAEREYWESYMDAYQRMLDTTSQPHAPWHVIPSDKKWYRNMMVTRAIIERLEGVQMSFPRFEPKGA